MKLSVDGCIRRSVYMAFAAGIAAVASPVIAQEGAPAASVGAEASKSEEAAKADEKAIKLETVKVTGTRVSVPGATSASPIVTIRSEEFSLQQTPEVEQVLRNLPSTQAADGSNSNNGTAGAASLNLRGLGEQRNLIMIDGKRLTPYDINGVVDTSIISTALLDRVDVVTGGASAVYGSDAMSGVVNFIMKRNFEGVSIDYTNGITEEDDGDKTALSMAMGTNLAGGKGNIAMSLNYSKRDGVQLGQRGLGQLGIVTENGAGLSDFYAGTGPVAAPAGCGGPGSVAVGGSPTTLPTRIAIAGMTPSGNTAQDLATGAGTGGNATGNGGQFRDDGTLGANCSMFNFNPFNYYETPQERYGGAVFGHFEFNDHVEAYSRFLYSNTSVRQQVAPSLYTQTTFVPLANPFIGTQARDLLIAQANNARTTDTNPNMAGVQSGLPGTSWRDNNSNGVVDAADDLRFQFRRRTVELGERSTTFNTNAYQAVIGARGKIWSDQTWGDWDYDVSYQRGQSERTAIYAGYVNNANATAALQSTDGVTCANGDPTCVPLNLFGGFGSITPAMARYSAATALQAFVYDQHVTTATVSGLIDLARPLATRPVGVSIGVERRRESGSTTPDECLKLAPTSCLGGNGGNTLPVAGGFHANELFTEAIVPLVDDLPMAKSVDLELGYRWADFDQTGLNRTWKYGVNWAPTKELLVRVMQQRAARAPNVGELAAPRVTGLDNATFDPCSAGNPDPIDATLRQRCIDTGVPAANVGTVEDVAAGQINVFTGTDLANLPKPEKADTTTLGFVFQPGNLGVIRNPFLSLDYYTIKIKDYIGTFGAQDILDGCYGAGFASECAKIHRVDGSLAPDGAGVDELTTNLDYLKAEGLELVGSFGISAGAYGRVKFGTNANYYLSQEFQAAPFLSVVDCKGKYGNQCGNPLPEFRLTQRATWEYKNLEASAFWRYMGGVDVEKAQVDATFEQFRHIGGTSYFDASVGYSFLKKFKVSFLVSNLFEKAPPVVGNEAADTRSNSGNTFPSAYDVLGRAYSVGFSADF